MVAPAPKQLHPLAPLDPHIQVVRCLTQASLELRHALMLAEGIKNHGTLTAEIKDAVGVTTQAIDDALGQFMARRQVEHA